MHLSEDDLVLHYYGEMTGPEEGRTTEHLGACAACQTSYARLQRVLAMVDAAPAADAPPGFERIAWARLEAALPAQRRGWRSWFELSPARLAWAAGVVVLVGAAFLAGRFARRTVPPAANPGTIQSAEKVRERILLVDLGDHLDRSQMVLVELVSADEGAGPVDISSEQARAQQLLASNRLYRQTAVSTGDTAMASVLDDLERVLVDVAASPSTVSAADFDAVRRRIDAKGLLFKVRVVSSEVRERQRAALQRTGT
jgi:anti-sigma factor RsiW